MSSQVQQLIRGNRYSVESVEKTDPPDESCNDDWYRYVIGRGKSKIEGLKPGTLHAVTQHAEAVAEDLNSRISTNSASYGTRRTK
ncbi:MAG: hypothetical protein OEZ39_18195 [Gammaproteobacteria bacterium]|nr:hypothetical protein [Gammaproteobacteria bacterium]MDH5653798.1 hypothetical protein [Gammaproteobacteria bacterium]